MKINLPPAPYSRKSSSGVNSVRELYANQLSAGSPVLGQLVSVHENAFPNDALNNEQRVSWVTAKRSAIENGVEKYFVYMLNNTVTGYILWKHIGGFRGVIELEQIGVHSSQHGRGIGTSLIDESIVYMEKHLRKEGFEGISKVRVTTGTDNEAQGLYSRTLGAKIEAVEHSLFDSDEAIMHAARKDINKARKQRNLATLDDILQ